jgi:hypothetical protein
MTNQDNLGCWTFGAYGLGFESASCTEPPHVEQPNSSLLAREADQARSYSSPGHFSQPPRASASIADAECNGQREFLVHRLGLPRIRRVDHAKFACFESGSCGAASGSVVPPERDGAGARKARVHLQRHTFPRARVHSRRKKFSEFYR